MKKLHILLAALFVLGTLLSACASPATQATSPGNAVSVGQGSPQSNPAALAPGSVALNGAGATFPQPVYTEWIYAYQYVDPSVTINYQGIGSGGGKKAIIDRTVDFAGSDSLVTDAEYTAGKDLQMYPTVAGAVVPIYNVTGITTTLTLDRSTLVGIYDGTISKWNDPAITKLNPEVANKLPDANITVVHRSDGSGTTEMFTRALSAFSDSWKQNVGAGTSVEWPVDKKGNGIGGKGNQGVAAAVQNTPNSIGYVELSYAVANKIAFGNMINKAGNQVTANAESLASAMSDYANNFTDQLTNIIVDGSGAKSWPIAGYTYFVLHQTSMTDCTKAEKLLSFIKWALSDPGAAKRAADLGYSVLPTDVQAKVLTKLSQVTCNGKQVLSGH